MQRIRFIMTVWGDDYLRNFCNITIPSLLQDGNIPYFTKFYTSIFHIITDKTGYKYLKKHSNILALSSFGQVFIEEGKLTKTHKFDQMTELQNYGVRSAIKNDDCLGFLFVDGVWSKNSFVEFVDALQAGKRVVASFNFRTNKHEVIDKLIEEGFVKNNNLKIDSKNLVNIALNNLHSLMLPHFWGHNPGFKFGGHMVSETSNGDVFVNTFLPVPYIIIPENTIQEIPFSPDEPGISNTYHDVFLNMMVPDADDYYIARNSCTHFNIELSSYEPLRFKGPPTSKRDYVLWAEQHISRMHWEFFLKTICISKLNNKVENINHPNQNIVNEIVETLNDSSTLSLLFKDWRRLFARASYYHFKGKYDPKNFSLFSKIILRYIVFKHEPWKHINKKIDDSSYFNYIKIIKSS